MPYGPKAKTPAYIRKPKKVYGSATDKFYNSTKWRKTSKSFLYHNPLCYLCQQEDLIEPAVDTDHIIPISHGGAKWDHRNFQPLCKRHHNQKSAREKHGHHIEPLLLVRSGKIPVNERDLINEWTPRGALNI